MQPSVSPVLQGARALSGTTDARRSVAEEDALPLLDKMLAAMVDDLFREDFGRS
jgi:hypothetical protein